MESEHGAAAQGFRAVFDSPDGGIAVFHRKRKIAGHEGGAHALVFALGHAPGKHKCLGAAANGAVKRPYAHFARPWRWKSFLADFGLSARSIPERLGNFVGPAGRQVYLLSGWNSWAVAVL